MNQGPDLRSAVGSALRAPSIHNTQPWRWRLSPTSVELYADWTRHLPWTDPDRRDLVLSCGAALHHLRVALAAQDLAVEVRRMPDPENEAHLATVTVRPGPGDPVDATLFPAINRRRTERRRMSHRKVPPAMLRACADQADRQGASLLAVNNPESRENLLRILAEAAHEQDFAPGYTAELQMWTRRYAGGRDGISAESVATPPSGLTGTSPLRRFPRGQLRQPRQPAGLGSSDDAAELAVVTTSRDDVVAWLRGGEATSAVLLTATLRGLATTPLSQALEVATMRRELRETVLGVPEFPQLILRIGWPSSGATELPMTARRELASVLLKP